MTTDQKVVGSNLTGVTWSICLHRGMICLHTSVVFYSILKYGLLTIFKMECIKNQFRQLGT